MLDCAPGRAMRFREIVGEFEPGAERIRKTLCVITLDLQAAAFLRTVECEGADDHLAAWRDRRFQAINVGVSVGCLGQEMKRRAIVPDVVGLRGSPLRHVGCYPVGVDASRSKPCLRSLRGP